MPEKKMYLVVVESVYTEHYYLEVDDGEEITTELLERKGMFEETLEFQHFGKIIDVEEEEDLEDVPGLVLDVTGVKQVFNEQEG